MNEFVFVLDASALSRRFYDDVGKNNLDKIFNYPNSSYYIPDIGIIETCSALLALENQGLIRHSEYQAAMSAIYTMIDAEELNVIRFTDDFAREAVEILEKYKIQEHKSFNGMDSIYIIVSRRIAEILNGQEVKIVFVTSDTRLYNAAKDENLFDAFHFWTCDLGCGCGTFIPAKSDHDRAPEVKKCEVCGNMLEVRVAKISRNTCNSCNRHCAKCKLEICPSTFSLNFS